MIVRSKAVILVTLVLAACGGSAPTQTPGSSPTPVGATAPPYSTPAPGAAIGGGEVRAAMAQLKTLDSYQFTGWYFTGYSGLGTEQSLAGTQRLVPDPALDTVAHANTGQDSGDDTNEGIDGHYIRINDDIWVNTGDPDFFYHYDAATAPELIAQYEPYAVATSIANASGLQLQYQPVSVETVNGIESMHYGLSQADRDQLIQASGLEPTQWDGDVWLATNGGYLVSLKFGPVFEGQTGPGEGWRWDTTAINCACPINPPASTAAIP